MAAAKRSIELDPTSAVGHTALACATLLYENNRAMAKQEFERALELSPSYAMGRCWYANFYLNWARGDFEQGIAEARRALDSDPLSAYVTMTLGVCLFTAGQLDEAIDTCRRAIQLDPESFVSRWALGIALGMAGRFDRGGLHPRSCRGDVGTPLARPHRSRWSLRAGGKRGGGARPASRADGPRLAKLCLAFTPCAHGRGGRAT